MIFEYKSCQGDYTRPFPSRILKDLRSFLEKKEFNGSWTAGEVQSALLAFVDHTGHHLLINQAEPMFVYLVRNGRLWPEE